MNNACKSLVAAFLASAVSLSVAAESVKVTPLGSHDGEFCAMDRALIFEDPNGTRILYDAGRTVAGADDPRLGNIDVVLVSHVHGDHVGDRHIREVNQGSCGGPEVPVVVLPESPSFLTGPLAEYLKAAGVGASVGPPTGYVLTFTNGLVVYLSGDTGITAEQKLVVKDHYGAGLVVLNIGDTYTTGPEEAAYVVNDLIKPNAVIASHANEAATQDGMVRDGTRTKQFISLSSVPVHVPLSGKTMSFDGSANCTGGC